MGSPATTRAEQPGGPGWGLLDAFALLVGCATLVGSFAIGGEKRWPLLLVAVIALSALALSAASSRPRRQAQTSDLWWAGLLIPFGLGTWASFGYLGRRFHSQTLLLAAAFYLATVVAGALLNVAGNDDGASSDLAAGLWGAVWLGGAIHGYAIRKSVRHRLDEGDTAGAERLASS